MRCTSTLNLDRIDKGAGLGLGDKKLAAQPEQILHIVKYGPAPIINRESKKVKKSSAWLDWLNKQARA